MKRREPISHIMTKNVYTANEEDRLHDVVQTIRNHKIHHLPIVKGNQITGIISSTDINRLSFGALFDNQEGADEAVFDMLTIPQVMTGRPETVSPDTTIKEVAEIFAKSGFHALPVAEGEELKGIVTTTDMIKYLLDQY